ncbi:N-formylglutamate amidohydrolase [Altererythrobacter aquiaggeris]|uniref:N-formylglutamate amidohydrolase n=1 Tax=Aestuarierythrobacter aquiaggeris TaxID=1898396 RepID=UPI0030186C08
MIDPSPANRDSRTKSGGTVPGPGGLRAFHFSAPGPSAIPVLIAAPHGGRAYSAAILADMRDPAHSCLKLEDRFIDVLAQQVARMTGASFLIADAPRALIDLNRSENDVDWGMIEGAPGDGRMQDIGRRALSGLGLIPRRLPDIGDIWRTPTNYSDLDARIEGIHRPYHAQLSQMLGEIRRRWGAALLLDLHSMPPLSAARYGSARPEFVVGDRFGASCAQTLSAAALGHLGENSRIAGHNRPYAGGYVLDQHARPKDNIHALQIEVCRAAYLTAAGDQLNGDAGAITELLAGLVRRLAGETAVLTNKAGQQEAAE